MQIEWVEISSLKPNPKNPNEHSAEQITRLAEIIKYQGWRSPIIVDKDLMIWAGHGRLLAAKEMGLLKVPVHIQEFADEDQSYSYMVSDNAIASWASLDLGSINARLADFDPSFNIDLLGLKDFVIEPAEKLGDEDAIPDGNSVDTRCKLGDLWSLGDHRLLCGDSTDRPQVERLMNGEKADMVFTDPPYGVSYTEKNEYLNSIGGGHRLTNAIENDSRTVPEMFELWKSVFDITAEACHDRASYYICSPQGGELMMMMQAIDQSPWSLKHTLIWNKNNHVLGRCDYHYKHEPILYGWKKKGVHDFVGGGEFTKSVWDIPKPHNSDLHPTMKPIELMENALKNSTVPGATVIDIFLGSGSTLIACEKTNRRCFGSEIDPHYVDVIIERWQQYSGKTAYLIEDANGALPSGHVSYAELSSARSRTPSEENKNSVQ